MAFVRLSRIGMAADDTPGEHAMHVIEPLGQPSMLLGPISFVISVDLPLRQDAIRLSCA